MVKGQEKLLPKGGAARREGQIRIARGGEGIAELAEIEALLRHAESGKRAEPSIERWAEFNESLMKHAQAPVAFRPLSRQWRRRIYDRLLASDGFLRENVWVRVFTALFVILVVILYLAA